MTTCDRCGAANPPKRRFCGQCGAPLIPPAPAPLHCAACGNPNEPGKRFCTQCGAPLAVAPPPTAVPPVAPPAVTVAPPAAYAQVAPVQPVAARPAKPTATGITDQGVFWRNWLLAHILLFGIARAWYGLANCGQASFLFTDSEFLAIFVPGIFGGGLIALAQWFVLRRAMPIGAFRWAINGFVGWWLGLVAAGIIGVAALYLASLIPEISDLWPLTLGLPALLAVGIGFMQLGALTADARLKERNPRMWLWRYGSAGLGATAILWASIALFPRGDGCARYALVAGRFPAEPGALLSAGMVGLISGVLAGLLFAGLTVELFLKALPPAAEQSLT